MKTISVFLIFIFLGCATTNNREVPEPKGNIKFVQELLNNHKKINIFLNDTNISHKALIYKLKYKKNELQDYIELNKFNLGYDVEYIDTIKKIYTPFTEYYSYEHEIKIKSKYNNQILWFGFTYDDEADRWKICGYWFCNNPIEMIHYGEPCDKK